VRIYPGQEFTVRESTAYKVESLREGMELMQSDALAPRYPEGYIYLNDTASWGIYCSRCGRQPFGDFARREPAAKWAARVTEHVTCSREAPGGGTED